MSLIAIVTGASSGFGRMIAHDLAHAGHKIYASMRDTTGRNADKVAEMLPTLPDTTSIRPATAPR